LGAAVGALLAMSMVPYVNQVKHGRGQFIERGYLPIYKIGGVADVNVPQLVLNVSFAVLLGALASNLSRRARRVALWTVAIATAVLLASWAFNAFQEEMKQDAEREERVGYGAVLNGNFDTAKEHLLKASKYWWWKGWWKGAVEVERKANDRAAMDRQYRKEHEYDEFEDVTPAEIRTEILGAQRNSFLHSDSQRGSQRDESSANSVLDLRSKRPIMRALSVSPAPTALKIPASPPNH
jgi:hypothetical protein